MKFCTCGHPVSQHSKLDAREWCAYPCKCRAYEFAAEMEDVLEGAAREAMERFQRDVRRSRFAWEPDAGDREWSARKDASAKGRTSGY